MTTSATCRKCGQVHQKCQAHARTGKPCGRPPVKHLAVCVMHGGASPLALKKAEKAEMEERAREEMHRMTLGAPVDISPSEALLEEIRWTAGHVQWLRTKVQELEQAAEAGKEHPLVWGTTQIEEVGAAQWTGTNETSAAGESIWYTLYMKERQHLVAVSAAALRAGVEERRVRIAEQQGDLVATAIRLILNDLGLTPQQQDLVSTVVPRHLRALAGGAA